MSAIFWCITVLVWATSLTVPYGRGDYAACKCLETPAKEAGSEGNGTGLTTCATPSTAGTLLGRIGGDSAAAIRLPAALWVAAR